MNTAMFLTGSTIVLLAIFLVLVVVLISKPPIRKKTKVKEDIKKIKDQINGKGK